MVGVVMWVVDDLKISRAPLFINQGVVDFSNSVDDFAVTDVHSVGI